MSEKALQWDHRSLDRGKIATTWDIYMLGITIVIGGQMFSWNNALEFGFNHALLSTLLMGIAYSCLTFCIAELTSTFPFSGIKTLIFIMYDYVADFFGVVE